MGLSIDQELTEVFGRNFGGNSLRSVRKGIKAFLRKTNKTFWVLPKKNTRGELFHAFYSSGVANSLEEAEGFCDLVDGKEKSLIRLSSVNYFEIRKVNQKYVFGYRTTSAGIH